MTTPDRIVVDDAIAHGKPVIRGKRIPVTLVVGSLAGGMSFEEVQWEYNLTPEDIRAALEFVGEMLKLTPDDQRVFVNALLDPSAPSEALEAAAARYRAGASIDERALGVVRLPCYLGDPSAR